MLAQPAAVAPAALPPAQAFRRPVFYSNHKLAEVPQLGLLPPDLVKGIRLAALVFPVKLNTYVLENLVDWRSAPDDPMFRLVFPHPDMLDPEDRERLAALVAAQAPEDEIAAEVNRIRETMNPHSSDQRANVPLFGGEAVEGVQHKYAETVLFFPKQGQTCHSYCSFCFRWPQFVSTGMGKFEAEDAAGLQAYLRAHPEVSDLLVTGGDPMVMTARRLAAYLEPLLHPDFRHVRSIRIGSKALTYWPHRFLAEKDSADLLALVARLSEAGKHVAVMAHVNHWRELEPEPVQEAVAALRRAGATIRTQSPVLRHINDDARTWQRNWADQVSLGMVPYYMFVERDTGANAYFGVPLARVLSIYQQATGGLSGLGRTARGPVMSAGPGKVQVLGRILVRDREHFVLSFLQARRREWLHRPFLARYSPSAAWLTELEPPEGEGGFFFEESYRRFVEEARDGARPEALCHA